MPQKLIEFGLEKSDGGTAESESEAVKSSIDCKMNRNYYY